MAVQYRAGRSLRAEANALPVHHSTVAAHLEQLNVRPRPTMTTDPLGSLVNRRISYGDKPDPECRRSRSISRPMISGLMVIAADLTRDRLPGHSRRPRPRQRSSKGSAHRTGQSWQPARTHRSRSPERRALDHSRDAASAAVLPAASRPNGVTMANKRTYTTLRTAARGQRHRSSRRGGRDSRLRRRQDPASSRPSIGSGPAQLVPVRIDPDLLESLRARAIREHATNSDVIRAALREYLAS